MFIILTIHITFQFLGEYNKIINLLLEGYDHILDLETDKDIITLSSNRGHSQLSVILQNIPSFEVSKVNTNVVPPMKLASIVQKYN